VALVTFAVLALGCGTAAAIRAEQGGAPGKGLSEAVVCAVMAGAYVPRLRRANALSRALSFDPPREF
jgi:hypothetical protein